MTDSTNELGQPVGNSVTGWQGAAVPPRSPMLGRFCRIEVLDPKSHIDDLYDAFALDNAGALWTYMAVGPFESKSHFRAWLETECTADDPLFHTIIDLSTDKAVGLAAYMRIKPGVGVIEIGNITYSPSLQRTTLATEAMFLFLERAFDELGYRRYEWKCDSLNAPSCMAAHRLGFSYDGKFEQAIVYKGRNRDTAWYSILDRDWPRLKRAYARWLDKKNFDEQGVQKQKLHYLIAMER
ncbi:MAG: GNAT family N-acetyltransferase [Gammaproteobacteria bacterium]|nr:GNAT family N-acetyltransferase [Gammaproteobacteria bacterium]